MRAPASLRLRSTVAWLGAGFVSAILAIGLAWLWHTHRLTLEAAERKAATMAILLAEHTARSFDVVDRALAAAADGYQRTGVASGPTGDALTERLRRIRDGSPVLLGLAIVNAQGEAVASLVGDALSGFDATGRDYFEAQRQAGAGLYIGPPGVSRVTGQWILTVSRRITGPDGAFGGIAFAAVDPSYFTGLYRSIDPGSSRTVALLRTDGRLLARDPRPPPEGNEAGDGERRIMAYASVPGLPLVVAVGLGSDDALALWHGDAPAVAVPMVLLALLAAGLGALAVSQADRVERQGLELAAARARSDAANRALARANATLRAGNAEMNAFTTLVSHDLRAPLASARGFAGELRIAVDAVRPVVAELLADRPEQARHRALAALDAEIPEALDYIETSLEKMDGRVSAILKLARVGRLELSPAPVNTGYLVRELGRSIAYQLSRGGGEMTVGDLPVVISDRTALEEIFANLLDNAVKYLVPGRPGRIAVTAERDGRTVVFRISDNGCGISPENRERIFGLFQRGGEADRPGDGIGLAYTRALARRLGGDIDCTSEPGEGSVFTVTVVEPADPA